VNPWPGPARAPIPWRAGPGHGFTTGEPWLPFARHADASAQARDPGSALTLTRALAKLRRQTRELQDGEQRLLDAAPGVLAFTRGDNILVAVNFRGEPAPLPAGGERVLSSESGRRDGLLAPYEGAVLRLSASATRSSS